MLRKPTARAFALVPVLLLSAAPAPSLMDDDADLAESYRETAGKILGATLTNEEGWEKLLHLTTAIGHRLSGSPQLEEAIEWAEQLMTKEGLEVRLQPVEVNHWVRGNESLRLIEPVERELQMLGLGNSIGTEPEGIEGEVVVVESFDELDSLDRSQVEGKIVLYAVEWDGYGSVVRYRSGGADRASQKGAIAALVRSATGRSLYTPHTGGMRYAVGNRRIPAAAVTVEDAEWLKHRYRAGDRIRVRLQMDAQTLDPAQSYNVIAEIPGRERPEEVVVMGGHYDSWDVGQGAHDDGAACIAAWHALTVIHDLGLRPRRTLRVVLWTNEENGLAGGRAYRIGLSDEEVANHVAAIEMDGGNERPIGFGFTLPGAAPDATDQRSLDAWRQLREIAQLFEAIDADQILPGGGGADISPLMRDGVPGLALRTVGEHYFDWHHTSADTIDKVDPQDFRKAMALLGVMGYVLADMPARLGD